MEIVIHRRTDRRIYYMGIMQPTSGNVPKHLIHYAPIYEREFKKILDKVYKHKDAYIVDLTVRGHLQIFNIRNK